MKEFIAGAAILILLLTFPLQYALEQQNHYKLSQLQMHVHNAKEEAKQLGYFSDAIINTLKSNISGSFKDISPAEVIVSATTLAERKPRGEELHYRIQVPLKKLIAANLFWGIDEVNNKTVYIIDRYTTSEWVNP